MKIAYYNDFIKESKLEKTIQKLENQDFSQAKKLSNSSYFRIKVDYEDRIIFTFLRYENETYILILEYIPNHEYQKSQFLRGKKYSEEDFEIPQEIEEAIFVNDKKEFRYLEKFISFSQSQEDILNAQMPIIFIGSAGSGKTSILIEKLRTLKGNVLYISLSKNLVEKSKEISNCSNNVDFLTFEELFNIQNEISFDTFKAFAQKQNIRDFEKYFEEFRGVITGNFEKPYLSESEYLDLGVKHSLFSDRKEVYEKFEKYLLFLQSENLSDSNIENLESFKEYDCIVLDEVQDFTNAQISAILKNGKEFILSGDSNQIIYSNFFSWSKLKTMLFKTEENAQISILRENYRNSQSITNISNKLLKIKQLRFGSIDKESNYLIETISKKEGQIFFWTSENMVKEINEKKKDDVNFSVIVFDEKSKNEAKKRFKTPLVFTVKEAKGLEYKNIILFNFISNESKKFLDIVQDIEKSDLEKELKYSRPKDKTDRELDIYKIYINSLYVAFTRGVENLYIIEKQEHKIWEILGLIETKEIILNQTSSENSEWRKEAKKLEKFGRVEQLKKIYEKIEPKAEVNILPKKKQIKMKLNINDYKKLVFEDNKPTKSNKSNLFKLAKSINDLIIIKDMAEKLNFKSAKVYLKILEGNNLEKAIKNRDINLLKNSLQNGISVQNMNIFTLVEKRYSIEFMKILLESGADVDSRGYYNMTALIIASVKGDKETAKLLIGSGANLDLQDKDGKNALIHASYFGHTAIVELFITHGANTKLEAYNGFVPLIYASQEGNIEIVKYLIRNNIYNIDLQSKEGYTSLQLACENGHIEIVKFLIKSNANINLCDKKRKSALIRASMKGHIRIVNFLVEQGININIQSDEGVTALMYASLLGYIDIVKFLIEYKADINLKNKDAFTALMLASQEGYIEIEKLLHEAGAK